MTDFLDISYLARGNSRQRKCYAMLRNLKIMDILAPFDPVLTGTIPIRIDIPASDLDIVCEVRDGGKFKKVLEDSYGGYDKFSIRDNGDGVIVCGFFADGEEIEVFGSPVPSVRNNAYRHMLIEDRMLNLLGEDFRRKVVELKTKGLKTEPAFAKLLGLPGDPYMELLELENRTDGELSDMAKG